MVTPTNRRTGFTLIELLVVIALIATLAALSAGAFMRVRAGQMKSASEATLNKLGSALQNRKTAIIDSVKEDHRKNQGQWPNALAAANGNSDVAESLLIYAKMKNELPMTFAEARVGTILTTTTGSINLPARASFSSLPNSPPTNDPVESAICFYLAVTTSAGGGAVLDGDGLQQQTTDVAFNGGNYRVFKDSWGTPITFVRQAYTPELRLAPYIRVGQEHDPYDQTIKLPAVMTANPGLWGQITWSKPTYANIPAAYPGAVNFEMTVVSAGPNKLWEADLFGGTDNDNLLGYRLRRQDAKGD